MSTARHVFEGIKGYLAPLADHIEVATKIATILATERNTVPVEASAEEAQNAVSAAVDGPPRLASDAPVLIPAESNTPRGRADIRMGRKRGL